MFERIFIVLEPHLDAEAAIRTAVALSDPRDAEVVLCSGLLRQRAPLVEPPDGQKASQWDTLDDARERAEHLLRQAQRAAEALGVMSRSVTATGDDPVRGILDSALAARCDSIMVASEGSNAVVRLLTGNVIPGLITASPVPLIVCAPALGPKHDESGASIRRILVILEDDDKSMTAVTQALDLAEGDATELLFVHVVPPDGIPVVDISGFAPESADLIAAEVQSQSRRLLESACTVARTAGLAARGVSLHAGTPPKDIAQLAVDQACDLIVIAHRGSNAVVRLLAGSKIPGLVTAATVPVLICRALEEPPRKHAPRRRHRRHKATGTAGGDRGATP